MSRTNLVVLMAVYYRPEQLQKCLDSFLICGAEWSDLHLWVNGADKETQDILAETQTPAIHIHAAGGRIGESRYKNIGKAAGINRMMMNVNDQHDVICIADSDIVVRPGALTKLHDFVEANGSRPCIVVPEQTGDRCHLLEHDAMKQFSSFMFGRFNVVCSQTGQYIAGACMTLRASLFNQLNGFYETSLYGGNEAGLWHKFHCLYPAERICILTDAVVEHLPENDIGYQEWKIACQREIRKSGICTQTEYRGFANKESK